MSNQDEDHFSDDQEDYNPKKHKQLLQSIGRLGKTQHIKKSSRSEPVLKQDEFHLSKTSNISKVRVKDTAVSVNDLVKILNKADHPLSVGKELKTTEWSKKVLPKPLEKPVADRIQRTIGYEKIKTKLRKWDAVVAKNRQSDHQVFPLDYEEIHIDTTDYSKGKSSKFSIKSELQIEMDALEEKLKELKGVKKEVVNEKDEERKIQQKLTRDELIAKRKELAYLRIKQSQKSAKERLHNKIKSKKFHKLLKKEKLKDELKQFELLQKTNPEAAIEQLGKLEKNRILERANLRHKNTGTWAKNLQVRAKYDRDVRKDLSEQLAISRELTQKHDQDTGDESDNENKESDKEIDNETEKIDPFNPWIKVSKKKSKDNSIDEVLIGYKQYWIERNENEKTIQEYKKQIEVTNGQHRDAAPESNENVKTDLSKINVLLNHQQEDNFKMKPKKQQANQKSLKRKPKEENDKNTKVSIIEVNVNIKKKQRKTIENGWIVEEINDVSDIKNDCVDDSPVDDFYKKAKSKLSLKNIDDIFDEAEDNAREQVSTKMKNLKNILGGADKIENKFKSNSKIEIEKDELENLKSLSFKNQNQRPDFDEQLNEHPKNAIDLNKGNNKWQNGKDEHLKSKTSNEEIIKNADLIDPNDFANIKPKRLHSIITSSNPDSADFFNEEVGDENEVDLELSRQMTIAEAFEDDDVVADFTKEKEDKNKQNDEVDLTMPGWGSWAGCGINTQNKKRLVLKFPEKEKRRDDNKGNLYINENVNNQLREHLVSDLPFPFTSVKDYEASIRAPVGRTFVPETAFRILTRPAVQTKMGHIIEPMNESVLVKKPIINKRHIVDKKIEKLLKEKENKAAK